MYGKEPNLLPSDSGLCWHWVGWPLGGLSCLGTSCTCPGGEAQIQAVAHPWGPFFSWTHIERGCMIQQSSQAGCENHLRALQLLKPRPRPQRGSPYVPVEPGHLHSFRTPAESQGRPGTSFCLCPQHLAPSLWPSAAACLLELPLPEQGRSHMYLCPFAQPDAWHQGPSKCVLSC